MKHLSISVGLGNSVWYYLTDIDGETLPKEWGDHRQICGEYLLNLYSIHLKLRRNLHNQISDFDKNFG